MDDPISFLFEISPKTQLLFFVQKYKYHFNENLYDNMENVMYINTCV